MLQIISSLVLQLFCTSECLFPQKSPILGSLVYFLEKVFHDLFNFKIKNSTLSPSSSVIHLSIPPCQSSIIFPVFQLNFLWNPLIVSFGLFNSSCVQRNFLIKFSHHLTSRQSFTVLYSKKGDVWGMVVNICVNETSKFYWDFFLSVSYSIYSWFFFLSRALKKTRKKASNTCMVAFISVFGLVWTIREIEKKNPCAIDWNPLVWTGGKVRKC